MSGPTGAALSVWDLANRIRPLADWQRANKPHLATLRIFASDYAMLLKHKVTARKYGFMFDDDEISFHEFLLLHDGEIRGVDATQKA